MNKQEAIEYFKNWGDKEDFYLDPFELLNKPRRLFTGLEIRTIKIFLADKISIKDLNEVLKELKIIEKEVYKRYAKTK